MCAAQDCGTRNTAQRCSLEAVFNHFVASTLAGVAGAVSTNLLHEITRHLTPVAPRVDLVGMRAVSRISTALALPSPDHLRAVTFAGDLVANSLYYGLVGVAERDRAVVTGAALGAAAGVGAVLLPPPMGLGDEEVNRTPATQVLTIALYLAGGIVSGLAYGTLTRRR